MAGTMQLAWRNLGRSRRRTLSTAAALAFGISLCVASNGLVDGLNAGLLEALTRLDLGHAQIHQQDYAKRRKLDRTIPDATSVLAAAEAEPGVRAVAPRSYAFGLLSAEEHSSGVQIVGVDPLREPAVTTLHERIARGRYLDQAPTPWPAGRKLSSAEKAADEALTKAAEDEVLRELDSLDSLEPTPPPSAGTGAAEGRAPRADEKVSNAAPALPPAAARSDERDGEPSDTAAATKPGGGPPMAPVPAPQSHQARARTRELAHALSPPPERPPRVLVGANLAKALSVDVGAELYLTVQTVDGSAESIFLEVAGVFETGTQLYDRSRLYMHIADVERLVHAGDAPHEIALRADSPAEATALAAALTTRLARPDLTVRSWRQIRPDIEQMLALNTVSMGLMAFIIFVVASLGVVNTMLMAVFERTRELGVLKAIGMSGKRIVSLMMAEALLLVVAASAVGTLLGLGMDLYMVHHGVDLRWLTAGISFGGLGIDPVLHGAITPEGLISPAIILSATCVLASLYPAIRAARMQPAVGMRET